MPFSSTSDAAEQHPSPALPRSPKSDEVQTEPESEAVPREADGYDWKEEATSVNELADGMASLAIDPTGSGYLGKLNSSIYFPQLIVVRFDCGSVFLTLNALLARKPAILHGPSPKTATPS